ncbi:RsbRD N-terminal domain-containing protein [Candidatus Desulfovibrio trichonymphae]|nr:RsbRD N-terminal domain-containing protein [Candidatus Desulfovibrio trichonymphae]GHU91495.1 hypothetical protein AGMMS49925_06630 [Deltaproteobacteria bacterium]GHU98232.1 hypothetical protein AGMMS50248_04480 [Deltaproteobacteria bacterium]
MPEGLDVIRLSSLLYEFKHITFYGFTESMNALECFRGHKDEILRLWTEAVYATCPLETTGFPRTLNDPFGNPAGDMTREAALAVYNAVAGEDVTVENIKNALERFVRLRAVQKGTPGQSIGVFYLMKPILRERLLPRLTAMDEVDAYLAAESRLDSLTLLAFDMYMEARETVAESRIKEIRNQYAQLARWARTLKAHPPAAG